MHFEDKASITIHVCFLALAVAITPQGHSLQVKM